MNDHQNQTDFLHECLRYDQSSEGRELAEKLRQTQRDLRCVRRAVWLLAQLLALAVAGLIFALILVDGFLDHAAPFVLNIVYALFMGLFISLLAFVGLRILFRRQVDWCREECRQSLARFLASHLGPPASPTEPRRPNQAKVMPGAS